MTSNEMALMASIAVDMQKNEVNEVLDKIRADVKRITPWDKTALSMKLGVLRIIDKYRKPSPSGGADKEY